MDSCLEQSHNARPMNLAVSDGGLSSQPPRRVWPRAIDARIGPPRSSCGRRPPSSRHWRGEERRDTATATPVSRRNESGATPMHAPLSCAFESRRQPVLTSSRARRPASAAAVGRPVVAVSAAPVRLPASGLPVPAALSRGRARSSARERPRQRRRPPALADQLETSRGQTGRGQQTKRREEGRGRRWDVNRRQDDEATLCCEVESDPIASAS